MSNNMYRVGDYVYIEQTSTSPYLVRRIEELNKTNSGNVEARVLCFYRRRDIPSQLIQLADKHQCALDRIDEPSSGGTSSPPPEPGSRALDALNPKQRHQLKHRELFLSRQIENLPATHIRGKCNVTLFNETENLAGYLEKDDAFFYCLVFDPQQKTLLADKGEIRVGAKYQCEVPPMLGLGDPDTEREQSLVESLIWTPDHQLSDRQIDQFLVVSRSVGTFARALDCTSSVKQPSLHMSAAAASRDVTLFHAMDALHKHRYDLAQALCSLVPSSGPVLCRDEMEEWSASEANLFEEALEKYGKDFNDIRNDFLPWKTLKNIVEYYYMWKTTDRYVQQKRVKAVEAESKLKQVYIPNYNKPNPAALNNNKGVINGSSNGMPGSTDLSVSSINGKPCESCNVNGSCQWYSWGPTHMQCRLCQNCWNYWKKYGGLKIPTRFGEDYEHNGKKHSGSDVEDDRLGVAPHRPPHICNIGGCGKEFKLKSHLAKHYASAHGILFRTNSPSRPVMKTRTAFYLHTTPLTRISRRLCRHIMRPRHAARAPFSPINVQQVKLECTARMTGKTADQLKRLLMFRKRNRGSVTAIATRLGNTGNLATAQWLILTDKDSLPKPEHVAFPKPPKAPDGSLLYDRIPNKPEAEKIPLNNTSPLLKKRPYEEMNGIDSATMNIGPSKSLTKSLQPVRSEQFHPAMMAPELLPPSQLLPRHISQINGKPKIAHMGRSSSGRKQVISWMDAPDDVYFRATDANKRLRKQVSLAELRRTARKPWRPLKTKSDDVQLVVLD